MQNSGKITNLLPTFHIPNSRMISVVLFRCGVVNASSQQNLHNLMKLPPFERAVTLTKYYEQWHTHKDYPYIGYGHRIQPGEKLKYPITEHQADSILRSDLRKELYFIPKVWCWQLAVGMRQL